MKTSPVPFNLPASTPTPTPIPTSTSTSTHIARRPSKAHHLLRLTLITCAVVLASCAHRPPPSTAAAAIPEVRKGSGYLIGYLPVSELPNSQLFLPAAPLPGSATQANDQAIANAIRSQQGTERWRIAAQDAQLKFPEALDGMSCALGFTPSEATTPNLFMLLRRTLTDAGLATYGAKNAYARERPFVTNKQMSCTPKEEAFLAKDGSYPSGHSAVGWAWALVASELLPAKKNQLLQRGYEFGQSRVVCGVHWQSDVDAGRVVGAAAVASLHANADFSAQLEAAHTEVVRETAKAPAPMPRCDAERAAFTSKP